MSDHKAKDAVSVETDEGLQYHLRVKPGDLADIVLMPGNPQRVKKIADYWEEAKKVADYRQFTSYTGKYKETEISAVSSGIGPSACEIAIAELKNVNIKNIIRVGSCGALQPEIELGDLVISEAAVRLEDSSAHYVIPEFPAYASRMITSALIKACEENNLPYHVGITGSSSSFYAGQGRVGWNHYLPSHRKSLVEDLQKANVMNFDMEASLMFIMGSIYNIEVGAVCAVYANRATNEFAVKGEASSIKAANEAAKIVSDMIKDKGDKRYWY